MTCRYRLRSGAPLGFFLCAPSKKSVRRYDRDMTFLALLAFKRMTIYRLSQLSGAPKITLADLCSGKTSLLDASGKTLLGISKALKVRIEELLELEPEEDMKKLPPYLAEAITKYRKSIRSDSLHMDCYAMELNSDLNIAEVEGDVREEIADRIRNRYF